jgi:ring-1,2-phenylacetyl-CoA epoxidase subunit PaaE
MKETEKTLIESGIKCSNVHKEYFIPPATPEMPSTVYDVEESKEEVSRNVKIILNSEEAVLSVKAGQNILQAALENDLDPPYSCRAGICSTCRAMLYSGKVKMDEREGLSDSEIEEGYILTCQSHPESDNIVIEYK